MTTLLFPGRHLVTTRFQEAYVRTLLAEPPAAIPGLIRGRVVPAENYGRIVFAITSSNQDHSRFNPVAFHLRAIGVDRFARDVTVGQNVAHRIVGIPHYGHTTDFAEFTLKELRDQSEGELCLTPENSVVLCSTPEVMKLYQALGYSVAPAEHGVAPRPVLPIELVRGLGDAGAEWATHEEIGAGLSAAAATWLRDFPEIAVRIARIHRDPLTTAEGSLTATRDYNTYARGMAGTIANKFRDIADAIRPGRIVDEGCADGALLVEVAKAFPDSDLYGVDLSAEFAARFRERQRAGEFGGAYTHFLLRNLMDPLFDDASIDTTICNSTLHELWSYAAGEQTVRAYLARKVAQLRPGGRLVIRDVVGPEGGDASVFLQCAADDGAPLPDVLPRERDRAWLGSLSTHARFLVFAQDFLADRRKREPGLHPVRCEPVTRDGVRAGFVTTLRAAAEFLSKKDYVDNWSSEMHEEFCFWSHARWREVLTEAGLRVLDERETKGGSRVYLNPWIEANRYRGHASLWSADGGTALPFPPTNQVLVAEKPTG